MATVSIGKPVFWAALRAAEKFIHSQSSHLTWCAHENEPDQARLIADEVMAVLTAASLGDDLFAMSAQTAQEVNAALAARKIDIQLDPWTDADTIGMAAVFKALKRKWKTNVAKGFAFASHRPAYVLQPDGKHAMWIGQSDGQNIARVQIEGGYSVVFLSREEPTGLVNLALDDHLVKAIGQMNDSPSKAIALPNLKLLDMRPNIGWIKEMFTQDAAHAYWRITQAKALASWVMGPYGVSAVAAAAMAATRECTAVGRPLGPDIALFDKNVVMGLFWGLKTPPILSIEIEHREAEWETVDVEMIEL